MADLHSTLIRSCKSRIVFPVENYRLAVVFVFSFRLYGEKSREAVTTGPPILTGVIFNTRTQRVLYPYGENSAIGIYPNTDYYYGQR